MHELGITENILAIALRTASENGAAVVKTIRLRIGEWTAIEPSCIEFYFSTIAANTAAENAEILVERVPLSAKCADCGESFSPENLTFKCQGCGSSDVEIISGREFYVESVEVE